MAQRDFILEALSKRCVEPQKRMVAGRFGWAIHRFPIKGGLPLSVIFRDVFDVCKRQSFFSRFMASKSPADSPIVRVDGLAEVSEN